MNDKKGTNPFWGPNGMWMWIDVVKRPTLQPKMYYHKQILNSACFFHNKSHRQNKSFVILLDFGTYCVSREWETTMFVVCRQIDKTFVISWNGFINKPKKYNFAMSNDSECSPVTWWRHVGVAKFKGYHTELRASVFCLLDTNSINFLV